MIILDIIEAVLRGIDGPAGRYLRRIYYKRRLKKCGKGVVIDCGVYISHPEMIELGDNVWLDKHVVLQAGTVNRHKATCKIIENKFYPGLEGEITIGEHSHIGIGCIIQGHGGVSIDRYFTASAGCKIYSLSNDPEYCKSGTMINSGYILHPLRIEENVWLGLQCVVLGHHIGKNTFVLPNLVIYQNVSSGIIYRGKDQENRERYFCNE